MEYEDLLNKAKENQFAALSALKTGDLSFIICRSWRQSKVQRSNGCRQKTKMSERNIFLPVLVIHFNLCKQSLHKNQLRRYSQFVYV